MPDVKQIVIEWLKSNSYDGLFAEGECACLIEDLMPCDDACHSCDPGYREDCPGGDDCPHDGDCVFHIVEQKEEAR